MKKICFALATLATLNATAQAKWDSTHRPANFELKVAQFKSYPDSKKDIVFLGNSITDGSDWNELLSEPRAKNRGISGDITYGVLERLDEVIEGQPAKVFILIGVNDISRNIPDSCIIANHQKMVERIKKGSPRTKIYLQTILPVNNDFTKFPNHYNKDEHIAAVNAAMKELAAREGATLIDLNTAFQDEKGKLKKEFTYDGLHLTAAGYLHWRNILKAGNYLK